LGQAQLWKRAFDRDDFRAQTFQCDFGTGAGELAKPISRQCPR
jgi:hypothetical protein